MLSWHKTALTELAKQRARLAQALLVHGREGVGQFEFALAFSQVVLCERPTAEGLACEACAACNWFALGNHPDFRLLQPESLAEGEEEAATDKKKSTQIRIAQVRALQEFLAVGTHRAGHRVIVLHPADAMNTETQNALLKSLEEPPPATLFLLVTSRPHRLLATVRSRCHAIALPFPDQASASAWLAEQGTADARALLALAGGAPLTAAGFAQSEPHRRQFIEQLRSKEFDAIAASEYCLRVEPPEAVGWLQRWAYDLLSVRLTGEVRYYVDEAAALKGLAAGRDPAALARFSRTLNAARALAQHPLNSRLFFEDLLFKYRALISAP